MTKLVLSKHGSGTVFVQLNVDISINKILTWKLEFSDSHPPLNLESNTTFPSNSAIEAACISGIFLFGMLFGKEQVHVNITEIQGKVFPYDVDGYSNAVCLAIATELNKHDQNVENLVHDSKWAVAAIIRS